MRYIKYWTAFSVMGIFIASALPAHAITAFNNDDNITVTSPSGTNNPSDINSGNTIVDDAFLDELTFESDSSTFTGANNPSNNSFRGVQRVEVLSGREGSGTGENAANVNAEFGKNDTNSDGNPTPFERIGASNSDRESTDPDIQDPALKEALDNRNLAEIADGEGEQAYELQLIFNQGISDNDNSNDNAPEIVLFERGINDNAIEVELITGGTFDNPTISGSTFSEPSSNYDDTGLNLNTDEINNAQDLGIIGLDLSEDFGLNNGETVFGVQITSTDGGADINSALLASQDPSRFEDVPNSLSGTPVPFEAEGTMGVVALGGYFFYRHRKKRKQALSEQNSN
jgi:hypothetical protein